PHRVHWACTRLLFTLRPTPSAPCAGNRARPMEDGGGPKQHNGAAALTRASRYYGCAMRLAMFSMPTHPPGRPVWETYRDDFATFELADQLGYDEVWIGEHFTSVWENIPDPLAFIAEAAHRTKRLRFGTGVLLMPFHNPLYAALRFAQLDHQTLGRVQLGVGSGGLTADKELFGLAHTPEEAS